MDSLICREFSRVGPTYALSGVLRLSRLTRQGHASHSRCPVAHLGQGFKGGLVQGSGVFPTYEGLARYGADDAERAVRRHGHAT